MDKLKEAIQARDAVAIEMALYGRLPDTEESANLLIQLLDSDWHYKHEDIVLELQRLKNPNSVKVLRRTAERKFEYLNHDNSEALARKCTWALADIGTLEAKRALVVLSESSEAVVAHYAKKRLNNWERESRRKST